MQSDRVIRLLIFDDHSSDPSENDDVCEEITTEVTAVEDIRDHHAEQHDDAVQH